MMDLVDWWASLLPKAYPDPVAGLASWAIVGEVLETGDTAEPIAELVWWHLAE